ncbi:TetR family transcriptional regulator C-terminal domain-containing protein [Tropicimonas sp. TH_r6]|uniref:TetR family transcriptional regulator C-terminal domain-containing protein n=1 Tax=Tropicimonas sp. TH_r6 TaxID=3082085 RepID=UPI002953E26C|nr:TetR family transcriptional regulator C-terminal domain-containing protein [Tropicimonas sp. TH_r6]MDV7142283.1 TetR family transcriptional regulator C-terminal domain-containing protein [Tropicimonas sp. TH_r6]
MKAQRTKPRKPETRIQKRNHEAILDAALEVFSARGFRGATVDQIAQEAGLSKPNLLYYFPSKEAMHTALLTGLLDTWLDPLRALDAGGEPIEEILTYVRRKLEMSRQMPRESRLFANEILQGGPRLHGVLADYLKPLVDDKAGIIRTWVEEGRIAPVQPYHLLFSVWSLTQHYADFDIQVRTLLADVEPDPFPEAERYLVSLFTRMLAPDAG